MKIKSTEEPALKFRFESNLAYQNNAINSIVDIFEGQEVCQSNFTVSKYGGDVLGLTENELGIGNRLELLDDEILQNVRNIQLRNGLPQSKKLESMDFSVEMETGTGKTYVYLKTIFELNKRYGFTKFIIVVPSIAIKEGTKKTASAEQKKVESQKENAPLKDQPQISFDTTRYDVGEVREGERISHTFIVKNTGTAQSSCLSNLINALYATQQWKSVRRKWLPTR